MQKTGYIPMRHYPYEDTVPVEVPTVVYWNKDEAESIAISGKTSYTEWEILEVLVHVTADERHAIIGTSDDS